MSESVTVEKPRTTETPQQNAFEQMQTFLQEKGELITHTIQYQKSNVTFATRLSFLGSERVEHHMDIGFEQRLSPKGDETHHGINITLNNKKLYEKNRRKEELPGEALTEITLVDPANKKREKVIIRPFDPVGRWLGLEKEAWREYQDDFGRYAVTESEEEAVKIVKGFTTIYTPPGAPNRHYLQPYTKEPVMSRRGFLRLAGIGAKVAALDTFLAHVPFLQPPSLSKAFWEQLETATLGISPETLKKEIEETFQVELVGPSTGMTEVTYLGNRKYPTAEWDGPRLKALINTLAELPPHLYLPRIVKGEEHKVRFVLMNPPFTAVMAAAVGREKLYGGWCVCHAAEDQQVVVNMEATNQILPWAGETRSIFIHEITHSLTTPEIDRYVRSIAEPIGIKDTLDLWQAFSAVLSINRSEKVDVNPSHLLKEFLTTDENSLIWTGWSSSGQQKSTRELVLIGDRIAVSRGDLFLFGEKQIKEALVRYAREYSPKVTTFEDYEREYLPYLRRKHLDEDEAKEALELVEVKEDISRPKISDYKGHIGYGAQNFHEFFSVAAVYYSKGRNEFIKTYQPFLGEKRAEMFYDGMKREIFRGREY